MAVESSRTSVIPQDAREHSERVAARLKFYFATLSCLGGLVLGAGNDTDSIPVIAVFFAIFGYVFVDWLELFALPPIAAYAAMAVAALYCVSDFSDLDAPGNRQMVAVAQLLVFVQAILMLQRKSRRIFEQLGVFCLLELIVAAVFNNAINYGMLLVPIAIIGAWALSLLSAVAAWDGLDDAESLDRDEGSHQRRNKKTSQVITVSAPQSVQSLAQSASRLPRIALIALAPSVLLVASIFFYALPRTTEAARLGNRGNALVGFSETLRLEQIGDMLQNSESALRIHLTKVANNRPYQVDGGLYLRGRVLEKYQPQFTSRKATAVWSSIPNGPNTANMRLPDPYLPTNVRERSNLDKFVDKVNCKVVCESMRNSRSLFAIAPYHRARGDRDVVHSVERWTLARRNRDDWVYPRISYTFDTNAFNKRHKQTDLIARRARSELAFIDPKRDSDYEEALLQFDKDLMPTAAELAYQIAGRTPAASRTDYDVAKNMERFLSTEGGYGYTLSLNAESLPGLDPIEQFLKVDRKGHCQYFASALVMMLRSQGIPARIVVGYRTDEYNQIRHYYVARQLHAHAWVEALIRSDQFPTSNRVVYGQAPSDEYWMRLDPTPGGGGVANSGTSGGVGQVFDLAEKMWDDYVVDMDSRRQDDALLNTPGLSPMSDSYGRLIDALTNLIEGIRAGQLGGGSLASRQLFSWPAAILAFVLTLVVIVLLKIRAPGWIKRRIRGKITTAPNRPTIDFYAETLRQLARMGVVREAAQTPAELAEQASRKLADPLNPSPCDPLSVLTSSFYTARFAGTDRADLDATAMRQVDQALRDLKQQVDRFVEPRTSEQVS